MWCSCSNEIMESGRYDLNSTGDITNAVFHILRNARVLELQVRPISCLLGRAFDPTLRVRLTRKK